MAAGGSLHLQMTGGGPWGFRLYGGDEEPVMVAKMRQRSKAAEAGLTEGDALLGINGYTCQGISHATAMSLIDAAHDLSLTIFRGNKDKHAINAAIQALGSELQQVPASAQQASYSAATASPRRSPAPAAFTAGPTALHQTQQQVVNGYGGGAPQFNRQEQTYKSGDTTTHVTTETSQQQMGGTTVTKTRRETVTQFGQKSMFNVSSNSTKPGVWSPSANLSESAPRNVHVHQNPDQSLTMTIGLGIDDTKENVIPKNIAPMFKVKKLSEHEQFKPQLNMWNPSGVSAPVSKPQPMEQSEIPLLPEEEIALQRHMDALKNPYPPHLQKVVFATEDRESTPDSPSYITRRRIEQFASDEPDYEHEEKKKVFADSAFYDDPQHKYPTIEEQVKMARKVAMSLLAPQNKKARGHRMFMRRMVKSQKWTTDEGRQEKDFDWAEEDEDEKFYRPDPWAVPTENVWQPPAMDTAAPRQNPIPVPPPVPTTLFKLPTLPTGPKKEEKSRALSAEEFERMRLMETKTDHSQVSPAVCFGIAADLRNMKGKGGKLFAKRVARSEKWVVDEVVGLTKPNPELIARIQMQAAADGAMQLPNMGGPPPTKSATQNDRGGAPVNRLKEMIDPPKPKMTPWDAAAQYDGNTTKAFEHLDHYNPYQTKEGGELVSKLSSAAQKQEYKPPPPVTAMPSMPTSGQPAKLPDYTRKIKPWGASSDHSASASAAPSTGQFRPMGTGLPTGGASAAPAGGFMLPSDGGAASFGGGEEVGYCDL